MKEDILEQVVDDYLQAKGYFTRHNVRFRPRKDHPDFSLKDDCVPSDIDVLGINPHRRGSSKVWVVSCKSWQAGFNVGAKLAELENDKIRSGRESWRFFRELMKPKWSQGFCDAVFRATGSRSFTYVTAVTRLSGDRVLWETNKGFRRALSGNPIRLITLSEMVSEILPGITKTPSSSDLGRTLQLLRAAGYIGDSKAGETG
ncbi:MAG: hypothetical protein HYX73_08710 [Acidobacteria bacterium]|nr:hypothetical protein [Acidobacteriota bacterium]